MILYELLTLYSITFHMLKCLFNLLIAQSYAESVNVATQQ